LKSGIVLWLLSILRDSNSGYANHILKERGDRSLSVFHEIDNKFFFLSKENLKKKKARSIGEGESDSDLFENFLRRNQTKENLVANFLLIDPTNHTSLFG